MQPTDHISTALLYFELPKRISGARYHLVATYYVKTADYPLFYELATLLASPKSATFTKHSESSRTLEGFKSL